MGKMKTSILVICLHEIMFCTMEVTLMSHIFILHVVLTSR